jgi:hypothetical protein
MYNDFPCGRKMTLVILHTGPFRPIPAAPVSVSDRMSRGTRTDPEPRLAHAFLFLIFDLILLSAGKADNQKHKRHTQKINRDNCNCHNLQPSLQFFTLVGQFPDNRNNRAQNNSDYILCYNIL